MERATLITDNVTGLRDQQAAAVSLIWLDRSVLSAGERENVGSGDREIGPDRYELRLPPILYYKPFLEARTLRKVVQQ